MDPYRYLPFTSRKIMQAWADRERPPAEVAWTPITKPLEACRVALLTTAGVSVRGDFPFDQQGERDDPWWGDPSWRRLPHHLTEDDVEVSHLHIDHAPIEADLDVVLPLRRLAELEDEGVIGAVATHHYSIMGYVLDACELVEHSAPEIAAELAADEVDLVLLVPV
jgi:D-proline reductase (dithiol) PrdB